MRGAPAYQGGCGKRHFPLPRCCRDPNTDAYIAYWRRYAGHGIRTGVCVSRRFSVVNFEEIGPKKSRPEGIYTIQISISFDIIVPLQKDFHFQVWSHLKHTMVPCSVALVSFYWTPSQKEVGYRWSATCVMTSLKAPSLKQFQGVCIFAPQTWIISRLITCMCYRGIFWINRYWEYISNAKTEMES